MSPLSRALLSLLIVFHLVAMVGSLANGTPPGDAIRKVTKPYERLAGTYQNWNMFAPNPPRSTYWMRARGVRADGSSEELPQLQGERSPSWAEWRYLRAGKVERMMLGDGWRSATRAYALWHCDQRPGAFKEVVIEKVMLPTPPPKNPGKVIEQKTEEILKRRCT